GERDLRRPGRRQAVGAGGGMEELARACEQFAPGLGPVRRDGPFAHTLGVFAGLRTNSLMRLSHSSIFMPAFFMIRDCWSTVRVLFQAQYMTRPAGNVPSMKVKMTGIQANIVF